MSELETNRTIEQPAWRTGAWPPISWILATVLVVTAALKFAHARELLAGGGLLSSREMLVLVPTAEVAVATIVVLARPRVGRTIALLTFLTFAIVSGWSVVSGEQCNCFGPSIAPVWPLLIDLLAIAAISVCRTNPGKATQHRIRFPALAVVVLLLSGLAAATMSFVATAAVKDKRPIPSWFGENLVGMTCPLFLHPDFESRATPTNQDLIILFRPDCEHCREFAAVWNESTPPQWKDKQVASVSITPSRWTVMPNVVSVDPLPSHDVITLHWSEGTEPFVAAPTILFLENGQVRRVLSGEDSEQALERHQEIVSTKFR